MGDSGSNYIRGCVCVCVCREREMWRLTLTKDKLLAPSHPWVQACCHLLQSLGVIILADQSITYYMLAPGASHGHDFLCLLKARHITLQRGNTFLHFQQAGSAAISNSTNWNTKKKVISVCRKKACRPSKVYYFQPSFEIKSPRK